MVIGALADVGGRNYLAQQALQSPSAFLVLVGKVLPLQLSGEGGGAITIEVITGVPGDDD